VAASLMRPLPLQVAHGGGYILRPGFGCCLTAGKPVPLQAGHLRSIRVIFDFFI
jgi:hypothetical protein